MATRLLPKSELAIEKANEKRNEIDQGLVLAKKVDSLRETAASEESKLTKFRSETLKVIKDDIDKLIIEKQALESNIESLNAQRIELMKPLNDAWDKVNAKEHELTEYALSLQNKFDKLSSEKKDFELKSEELDMEEQRITERERETIRLLAQADEDRDKSAELVRQNSKILEDSKNFIEQANKNMLEKEAQIAIREREIELESKKNAKEKRELEIIKARLDDQRATLEREINRRKKNG